MTHGGVRSSLEEPSRRDPLAKRRRRLRSGRRPPITAPRASMSATGVEQCIEDFHVVAAGGPVQGSLGVRADVGRVDVGAGRDEQCNSGGGWREGRPLG